MKMLFLLILCTAVIAHAGDMIVRVYTSSWDDLSRISPKFELDIAGVQRGQWYDIVTDRTTMDRIIGSGLTYEITVPSIALAREHLRGQYHSYDTVNIMLRDMANDFPAICTFDSLPIPTHEGRWLYGVKISDNPHIEEDNEPGLLVDALHHSREWAVIEVVLFFTDSILNSYGVVPEITDLVDNLEMYLFPIINADGFVYDYPSGNMWRKNREPFQGYIGTDCNRNYGGCGPDIEGDWGAVDEGEASHYPSSTTFCGANVNSGDETRGLTQYFYAHQIHANMSYHSYGEVIMWPWGWTPVGSPDSTVFERFGARISNQINRISGGTYNAGQTYSVLYPLGGGSIDWMYSYGHWVSGRPCLAYLTEVGTSFYQPVGNLDHICRENFKGLKLYAELCRDSIQILCEGEVAPPSIYPIGTVGPNFSVTWHAVNPDENHPVCWELVELADPSVITDDLESGSDRWVLNGFTMTTSQAHSGTHSLWSGNTNRQNTAFVSKHPYLVHAGDSVSFFYRSNLENNYDVAVVEVSENTKQWFNLDTTRFTGNNTAWFHAAYSLAAWEGTSIYVRFRCMYDGSTTSGGFYVDDIAPSCIFANIDTVADNIPDTLYSFTNHPDGLYHYLVRGCNTIWDWGDYSCLEPADVTVGIKEQVSPIVQVQPFLSAEPTVFSSSTTISFYPAEAEITISIYDIAGARVRTYVQRPERIEPSHLRWYGTDDKGTALPAGIYFIRLQSGTTMFTEKVLLAK
ncbi:immune inhibitor A [candidate division WOR-3 bacterium]|nr:immune inhibitor A [candidate division WOR-3 bacterium]